ncbi:glycine zipper 2TM domain-containing protein [Pontibacterium sp.]|jgi:outer membrane lipoprotein SlyB|uniref:glycine zipper 2TM domain-containing protein n=1 Tax=Pontibacterium sp. TaxID=2036026 RepID=UPI003567CB7F
MKKIGVLLSAVLSVSLLAGCAGDLSGSTYSREDARKVQYVRYGIVESVTPVVIEGRTDGPIGSAAGAIVGGIAGSTIGGGRGSNISAVIGAVAGGIVGNKIEESATRAQGQELTIQMESGEIISVVQEVQNKEFFRPGDQVRVLDRNGTVRVAY